MDPVGTTTSRIYFLSYLFLSLCPMSTPRPTVSRPMSLMSIVLCEYVLACCLVCV